MKERHQPESADGNKPILSGQALAKAGEFTDAEKAAMKARTRELKAEARVNASRQEGEKDLLAAIAAMPSAGRAIAERLHVVISTSAPNLCPKTWYGMPAYANGDGKVVCFFRGAEKFKERYMTLGFNHEANLDDGAMWPIAYALQELSPADEARISELVKRAVS